MMPEIKFRHKHALIMEHTMPPYRKRGPTDMSTIDEILALSRLLTDLRALRTTPAELGLLQTMAEVGELSSAMASESREAVQHVAMRLAVVALRLSLDGDPAMDDMRRKNGLGPSAPVAPPQMPPSFTPPAA